MERPQNSKNQRGRYLEFPLGASKWNIGTAVKIQWSFSQNKQTKKKEKHFLHDKNVILYSEFFATENNSKIDFAFSLFVRVSL